MPDRLCRLAHTATQQIVTRVSESYRREKGLSQAEMANRMGVDRAYISGLELGQRNPTVITCKRRCKSGPVERQQLCCCVAE
jgi:DNA-binding XRE family transcriptional regulator